MTADFDRQGLQPSGEQHERKIRWPRCGGDGCGSGLGRSHALMLAARGARSWSTISAVRSTAVAPRAQRPIRSSLRSSRLAVRLSPITTASRRLRAVSASSRSAIDNFGQIDILVNNAGVLRDKTFGRMELADFSWCCDTHLMGSVYCTKAALARTCATKIRPRRHDRRRAPGLYGNFGQANYGARQDGPCRPR